MTTVEILEAARGKIAQGWCQGMARLYNEDCKPIAYCCLSALYDADSSDRGYDQTRGILPRAIGSNAIIGWNDSPSRTKEEVLEAFDRAIEIARGEERV